MKIKVHPHKKARIEIIPLIDVIFFCLATFVLFTLTLTKNTTVPVALAVAQESIHPEDIQDKVTVAVNGDGEIFWNLEPVTYDQFLIRLMEYVRTDPEPKVFLSLDKEFEFGGAVSVLNEIRKAGLSSVGIMARTKPPESR